MTVFTALAMIADSANTRPTLTKEERAAKRKAASAQRIALRGGLVEKEPDGKFIRIVNAQKKVPSEVFDRTAASIKKSIMLAVEIVPGDPNRQYRPTADNPVVITVADKDDDATVLVAPEQAWAIVNMAALAKDSPSDGVLAARTQKEIWRALAFVLGAANSMNQPCLMRQINTLEELDGVQMVSPCPEPFNFMISAARKLGVGRSFRTTYKRACMEGWAPAPTNDVQKAIWEEVHRLPTEPIKIKPETKKVND